MREGQTQALRERPGPDRASEAASQLVAELLDLPTFPQIATRLLDMTQDDSRSIQDIAKVIEQDQALTAKVLRVANSAMYGCKRQIRTIQHATAMLGMENVRKYALTISVFGTRSSSAATDYEVKRQTWVHAMAVAVLGRLIAREYGCDNVETAVVAGLIHDIGKVVLQVLRPGDYDLVSEVAREEHLDLIGAERRVFGTDHCSLGAELGHRWNLPPDLVAVLESHHDMTVVKSAAPGKLAPIHLVHLSNFLCHQIGLAGHAHVPSPVVDVTGWAKIGMSVPDLVALLGNVQAELEQSIDYFDLGPVNLAEYMDGMDEEGRRMVAEGLASEEVQRQLRRRIADLALVTEGVLALDTDADVDEILAKLAEGMLGQLDFDRTVVYTADEGRANLEPRAVHGTLEPPVETLPRLSLLDARDPVVAAALDGAATRLRSGREYQPGQSELLDSLAVPLCGLVPLRAEGRVYGLVLVDNTASGAPVTDHDISILDTIGKQIGLALDRAAAYERLAEHAEELKDLAFRDPLTGLYNFRYLEEALEMEIQRAERYQTPFSLLMVDIDRFKSFNDNYGHQAGDEVLKLFARVATENLRDSDIVFRYGGEEFTVILPDTRKSRALVPAENLRKAVERASLSEIIPGEHDLRVTVSIGVASFPDDARTRASLIGFADDALYRAKEGGRNRVVIAVRRE